MDNLGIIGGSGIYKLESVRLVKEHDLDTPFGKPSAPVMQLELDGYTFYFIPRHDKGHTITPSEINYQANIYALKLLGVRTVVSVSAVGSLKEEHSPGKFVLPSQFIDWTKGQRARTFFGKGVVGHVSIAHPVEAELQHRIAEVLATTDINFSKGGTYVCIEGPQFSSKAESEIYRSFGADIIGMTNVPEAYLAKEAGMAYATVGMVTDYDCWKDQHCSVEEIMKVMSVNYKSVQAMMAKLVPELCEKPVEFTPENKFAVVTNPDLISKQQQEILDTLLK